MVEYMTIKEGFPYEHILPKDTVLSLFSAAFYGENDVKHLYKIGCRNVLMIDIDQVKLIAMQNKYKYEILCTDVFEFLKNNKKIFDIVISDQWSNDDLRIHETYFCRLLNIARKRLILGCTEAYIQGHFPVPGEYFKRSDFNGGTYWRSIQIT
jgi:hypothetical protein